MRSKEFVKMSLERKGKSEISFRFNCPPRLRKYFLEDVFSIKYSINIHNLDESILYIPAVGLIGPIAWATGADLYLESLDKNFLSSLREISSIFVNQYPNFKGGTHYYIPKTPSNQFKGTRSCMLFSAGIDSLTTYIRHKDEKPILIHVRGIDFDRNTSGWRIMQARLLQFTSKEKVHTVFVETNYHDVIDPVGEMLLSLDYKVYEKRNSLDWWAPVSHGLFLISLCAPIMAKFKAKKLYIASTHTDEFKKAWGSKPSIDNKIRFADCIVIHDGYELSRQDKIRLLKRYKEYLKFLKSCNYNAAYNCGKCRKCLYTIAGLVLEGIDPNMCNFINVNDETFSLIKQAILNNMIDTDDLLFMWRDIQRHIPENLEYIEKHFGKNVADFYKWLRCINLEDYYSRKNIRRIAKTISILLKVAPPFTFHTVRKLLYSRTIHPIIKAMLRLLLL